MTDDWNKKGKSDRGLHVVHWLIYGARGGKGLWPFNLFAWKGDS